MGKPHVFDDRGAGRIVRAVRKIERLKEAPSRRRGGMRYPTPGIPFKNNTLEVIPAFACMRVSGLDPIRSDPPTVLAEKPSTTYTRDYIVNGAKQVSPGHYGVAQWGPYVRVLHGTSFSQGVGYGPTPNQWYVSTFYPTHFTVIGIHDLSNLVSVARMEDPSFLLGQYESNVAQNASGTVQLLRSPTAGSEAEVTGWSVSGVNKFSAITGSAGDPEPAILNWINGRWYRTGGGVVAPAYGVAYFNTFATAQSAYSLTTFTLLTLSQASSLVNMESTTNGLELSVGGTFGVSITAVSRGYTDEWWGTTGTTGQTYVDAPVKRLAVSRNSSESYSILYGDIMRIGGSYEPMAHCLSLQTILECTAGTVLGIGAQVIGTETALITLHSPVLKVVRLDL